MAEFQVGGHKYKSGKLSTFKQWHIARRVGPVLGSLGQAYRDFLATKTPANPQGDPLAVLGPVGEALSRISDEDSEYIFNTCLAVTQRQQGGENGMWATVGGADRGLMFEDIALEDILQICWHVMQDNINFLRFMPVASPAATPAASQA